MDEQRKAGEDELVASNPNANGPDHAAGEMGVSSERVGSTGPGQHATDGRLDTSEGPAPTDGDTPSELTRDVREEGDEVQPEPPAPPVAGYNSRDPRSDDTPYRPGPSYERED